MNGFKRVTLLFLWGDIGVVAIGPDSVYGTTTTEKIQQAEEEKEQTQNQLDQTQGQIDSMKGVKKNLEGYLGELNKELAQVGNNLDILNNKVEEKKKEIEETQKKLEEVKRQVEEHYELMKLRIRHMYENGADFSYISALTEANTFTDYLSRAVYAQRFSEYDQKMLEKLKNLKSEVTKKEILLKEEEKELLNIQENVEKEHKKLGNLVKDTSTNISLYSSEISSAEARALQYEEEVRKKEEDIAALRVQLEKEREIARRAAMNRKKEVSELNIQASDRDLLAALIECEAGGESYEGKIAVGAVVMNRARSSEFPDSISGVIYQNRQFTPVASGRFAIVLARGASSSCYQAADEALSGVSNVGDCLFFRTVIPEIQGIIIGGHVFY